MKREIFSRSPEETRALGTELAREVEGGGVVWLEGPLGAGKTLLAKALFAALGVDEALVTSPTFIFINVYASATRPELPLHHVDLYRIETAAGLETLGLDEVFEAGGVVVVEWPERLGPGWLPPALAVSIEDTGGETRRISIVRTRAVTALERR